MGFIILAFGGAEIVLVLVVFLILFGSSKIPELAKGIGKGMKEFKKATDDIKREIDDSTGGIAKDINESANSIKKNITDITGDITHDLNDSTENIRKDMDQISKNINK